MIRRLQITLLVLFVGVWAMASETSVKNADGVEIWYDFDSSAKTASVTYKGWSYYTDYDEYIGNVVIPSKVTYEGEEYSVKEIREGAFRNCSSLTSITIPESVIKIGENAFRDCNSLTSITIPEGVTTIGDNAFYECSSFTSITIPEGVTEIGYGAFVSCYRLYEVYNKSNLTITAGSSENGYVAYYAKKVYTDESEESKLKTVGDYIFYVDEDNIELLAYIGDEIAITLPSDYEGKNYKIGDYAFTGYSSLTSVTLPENVTEIASGTFSGCSSLTSITLPDGVTEIGNDAFSGCSSLTNITIPDGVTEIGNDAFSGCSSLTSITLPEDVIRIGSNAFSRCSSLTSITIPKGVTEIENTVFYYCSSLTSITIPEGVTEIGVSAFEGCSTLTSITLPESVTEIGTYAFEFCSSLTSITIPEGVTWIGGRAFSCCSSLTSITIPEGVTEIGWSAFEVCSSLTSIDVASDNNNYTSIDGVLFSKDKTILISYPGGKKDVTSYAIPDGVTEIGSTAFYRCSSLTSITIPEGVTEIGVSAFGECYKLYEVYNKSNLTITAGSSDNGYVAYYAKNVYTDESGESKLHTVGDYIFYVDEDNTELLAYIGDKIAITLPSDYEGKDYIIANYGFYGCTSLTSVTIPEGVTEIGDDAFDGCSSLTSITIPESVTEIGMRAFSGCSSLASITIPESVTKIGSYAFYDCSSLTSITSMNVTPPSIISSFDGVDKSIPVYVPKQSVEAYKSAEFWEYFTNIVGKFVVVTTTAENGTVTGAGVYEENEEVTFIATPDEGYTFVKWEDGETNATRKIIVTEDVTLTAVFESNSSDSPISDIVADSVSIRLIGNSLIVEGAESYAVYALSGQCLGKVESLERGVYIVVADGVSKRIVVK